MKRRFNPFSFRGQTMIEVLIAVAVAVMILVAIVTLLNASNRRTVLARQSTNASKVAQETLEVIRNVRDVDAAVDVNFAPVILFDADPNPPLWDGDGCLLPTGVNRNLTFSEFFQRTDIGGPTDTFGGAPNCDPNYGVPVHLHHPDDGDINCEADDPSKRFSWCLHINETLIGADEVVIEGVTYARDVFVADSPTPTGLSRCNSVLNSTQEKQFTTVVKWDSPIGPQQRLATTCIVRQL
jgi:type II secretory pathway pseudopilin PulG